MRLLAPRPIILALTLLLVVGAIAFIELRLDAGPTGTGADAADAADRAQTDGAKATTRSEERDKAEAPDEKANDSPATEDSGAAKAGSREDAGGPRKPDRGGEPQARDEGPREEAAERIARKEVEYSRAEEIVNPSGFVNARDFSVKEAAGEKVVLLEFWTYTCFNCQNVQPHINAWHDEYSGDGLQVVGVHTPEFGFEREYANVEAAVREAGIKYPVVLDNAYATWNAYDNRYWPAVYLIDADGFVRYKHFGEGAYGETEAKIRELLAEKDRTVGQGLSDGSGRPG